MLILARLLGTGRTTKVQMDIILRFNDKDNIIRK